MNEAELKNFIKDMVFSNSDEKNEINGEKPVTFRDYPLGENISDRLKTPTGKSLNDVTLDAVLDGKVFANDVRITKETLIMQAQVAESVDRHEFAANLRRASELIAVPDGRILEIYNALRPYKSTKQELIDISNELKDEYDCNITAKFVLEAAEVYEKRGRLKKV